MRNPVSPVIAGFFLLCTTVLSLIDAAPVVQKSRHSRPVLAFTGDVMMSYEMDYWLEQFGSIYPFTLVGNTLRSYDITVGNLECPISTIGTPVVTKDFYFRARPDTVSGLKFAGFKIMSLANNHILDFGDASLKQTMSVLEANGIIPAGAGTNAEQAGKLRVINIKGVRAGFLAYNLTPPEFYWADKNSAGTATCDEKSLALAIKLNRPKVDFLTVIFHWGDEYTVNPSDGEISLGRSAIDSGADLVIGHHPHIVRPIEVYKGKVIAYSLGNFVFGSYGNPPEHTSSLGMVVTVDLNEKKPVIEVLPVNVFNDEVHFLPVFEEGRKAEEDIRYIKNISAPYAAKIIFTNNRGRIIY